MIPIVYEYAMDPIWQQLPDELVEHVCNQLPKVRRIDDVLAEDIRNQFFHLDKLLRYYNRWFGRMDAYDILLDDLNMINESDFVNIYDAWYDTKPEKRREYYYSVFEFV